MKQFRLDVSRKTGITTLWMSSDESPCGYTPLIGWSTIEGLREFAEMLIEMYRHNIRQSEKIRKTSDTILEQVFINSYQEGDFNEE